MSSDSIIPDGEYELDMSSLFSGTSISDIFGIRYGFRPDMMDTTYPSLMAKETNSADSYILKTESRINPKAVSTSQNNGTGFNQILFEGKMPPTILLPTPTLPISSILQQGGGGSGSSASTPNSSNSNVSSVSSSNNNNNLSEYILVYNDVTKKFKMEKFQGTIRMNKSREPMKLNQRLSDLQMKYSKMTRSEYFKLSSNTNTNSVVSNLMNSTINSLNSSEIASPMKFGKRKMTPLNTPLGTPNLLPSTNFHSNSNSPMLRPSPINAAANISNGIRRPSSAPSSSLTTTSRPSSVNKPKKSRLLRAAERQVRTGKVKPAVPSQAISKKLTRSASIPNSSKPITIPTSTESQQLMTNNKSNKANDSDADEIRLSPHSQNSNISPMSEEDIEMFADELEEEWGNENVEEDGDVEMIEVIESSQEKSKRATNKSNLTSSQKSQISNKPKSIAEVMDQGTPTTVAETVDHFDDDEEEWTVNLSDWEEETGIDVPVVSKNKTHTGDDDDEDDDSNDAEFELIIDDTPTFANKAKNTTRDTSSPISSQNASPASSPTLGSFSSSYRKPISMRELAAAGSLLNKVSSSANSPDLNNNTPKKIEGPKLKNKATTKPKTKSPAKNKTTAKTKQKDKPASSPLISIGTPRLDNYPSTDNSPMQSFDIGSSSQVIKDDGKENEDIEFDEEEFDRALEDLEDLDEEESEEE